MSEPPEEAEQWEPDEVREIAFGLGMTIKIVGDALTGEERLKGVPVDAIWRQRNQADRDAASGEE